MKTTNPDDSLYSNSRSAPQSIDPSGLTRLPRRRLTAATSIAAAVLASAATVPAIAQSSSSEPVMKIDEVVVTARRRQETLMDIPMQVSAFTSADIENAGYTSVLDLVEAVPGVTYGSFEAQAQGDSPSFRGVSNNSGDPTLQNSSKFIDGVYVSGSLYNILFTDIERVEVLKGPQSALFGRATFSGAINYITKKPTEELTGYVDATIAEFGETRLNGTISGPIIEDKLGFRLSAGMLSEGSDYDNITNGQEMNDNDLWTSSLSLQFTPTENLRANLYLNYSDAQFGEAMRAKSPRNQGKLAFPLEEKIGSNVDQLENPGIDTETLRSNLTIDWDLGTVTFSSITGYGNEDSVNESDGDYDPAKTFGFLSFLCNAGPFVGPDCDLIQTVRETELENVFQEFRVTSATDTRLSWLAGASYFEEEYYVNRIRNFAQPESTKTSENFSVFGSVSYDFSEQVTATFDARYQWESIDFEQQGNDNDGDFNSFLPRVIVEYTPNEQTLWYVSASKGNKPGDFNDLGTPEEFLVVDEEALWSYELGTKFSAPDNRYTIDAAIYFMDWTDQVTTFVDPRPTIGAFQVNAGETEIWGIDFAASYRFTERLSATLAYAYVDAEFQEFESPRAIPALGTSDVSGNATARTPENSGFASIRYNAPLALLGSDAQWFSRADLSYRDEQFIDEINQEFLESQTLVNLRAGIDTGSARITIWLDNAFDNDAPTTGFQFAQEALLGLPLGRQAGITASYSF